jgi:hypothetical protein
MGVRIYLLAIDEGEDNAYGNDHEGLLGARIIDPATMREVGASGYGAWTRVPKWMFDEDLPIVAAVASAVHDMLGD